MCCHRGRLVGVSKQVEITVENESVGDMFRFDDILVQEGFCPGGGGSTATFVDESDGEGDITSEDMGSDAGTEQSDGQGRDNVPSLGSFLGRTGGMPESDTAGSANGAPDDGGIDNDDGDHDRAPPLPQAACNFDLSCRVWSLAVPLSHTEQTGPVHMCRCAACSGGHVCTQRKSSVSTFLVNTPNCMISRRVGALQFRSSPPHGSPCDLCVDSVSYTHLTLPTTPYV